MLRLVLEIVFFLNCFAMTGLVLLQMSEHSGLGGAFGSGMSSTVFATKRRIRSAPPLLSWQGYSCFSVLFCRSCRSSVQRREGRCR